MGNFHGGGTIIKGGRFTTFDPADDGYGPPSRSKKRNASSAQSAKRKKSRRPQVAKQPHGINRKSVLHSIIDQLLLEREKIKLPRATPIELDAEVSMAGGPQKWAESQPEYAAFWEKKIANRERVKAKYSSSPAATVIVKRPAGKTISPDVRREKSADTNPTSSAISLLEKKRNVLMNIAIGRILLGKPEHTLPPDIPYELVAEIKNAGNLSNWARNQHGFESLYRRRLAKHEAQVTTTQRAFPPQIQTSPEDFGKIGSSRLLLTGEAATKEEVERLAAALGALPASPRLTAGGGKQGARNRKVSRKTWLRNLSPKQHSVWENLSAKQKTDYLFFGKVSAEVPKKKRTRKRDNKEQKTMTMSDAPASFIKKKLQEAKDDPWDVRKIDWDST